MPTVQISGFGVPGYVEPAHPKVNLISEHGHRLVFALAPVLTYDGIAQRNSSYDRVGRKPVLSMLGQNIRTLSFTAMLVGRDGGGQIDPHVSIEGDLHVLRDMARQGIRVAFENAGPSSVFWYRITALSITDVRRQFASNHITQAEAAVTLSESVEAAIHVGPLTGGAAAVPQSAGGIGGGRSHTVTSGETLSGIAHRYYGDAGQYRRIADANGITNPNRIYVGQVLRIP